MIVRSLTNGQEPSPICDTHELSCISGKERF
jgi:hypothetical protein